MGVWGVLGPLRNGENHALGTHKKTIEFVFNPEVIMWTLSAVCGTKEELVSNEETSQIFQNSFDQKNQWLARCLKVNHCVESHIGEASEKTQTRIAKLKIPSRSTTCKK